jgi:hypothetical protein
MREREREREGRREERGWWTVVKKRENKSVGRSELKFIVSEGKL